MTSKFIRPSKGLYIKLGEGGCWESDCIERDQTLQLGYREVPHDFCTKERWAEIQKGLKTTHKDPGVATRHANQIRSFYEADESVLWVTFFGDRLHWCFSEPKVTLLPDKSKTRPVIGQWCSVDITGEPLYKNHLSGRLLSMQGFRGTICSVKELHYLVQKINGIVPQEVKESIDALSALEQKIESLIRKLHWKDFEILVDLIFRQAGWQRNGVLGGIEKTLDLDLLSPITSERYAVQVKSRANLAEFESYQREFADMQGYTRLYFVVHTPARNLAQTKVKTTEDIRLWLPQEVAHWAVKYGLADWIISKAS